MAGDALLRDADGTGLAPVSDLEQERHQHPGDGLVKVEPLENLVQDALRLRLVVVVQCREKRATNSLRPRSTGSSSTRPPTTSCRARSARRAAATHAAR